MKVRSRLVLAFTYVLLTIIVALTVPLAVNLRKRAEAELVGNARVSAQNLAASIGAEGIPGDPTQPAPADLVRLVDRYVQQVHGRIIVMNANGVVLVDEGGHYLADTPPAVGQNYNTSARPEIQSALNDRTSYAKIRPSETLKQDILVAAAPIIDENGLAGAVRISENVQDVTNSVRRVTIGVVAIGGMGLVAGLLIAFGLAGSLARPLSQLASTANRLGQGDLSARAGDLSGGSELRDLAHSFDEMADRVQRTVEAQREFVANASHQLRTPLTGMKLRLESAVADAPTPDMKAQLQAADREVDRLAQIVDRLLTMASQIEEGNPRADLHDVAASAVERWRERAERLGAALEANGRDAVVRANAADLDQILDNLIDNALTYAPGSILIRTSAVDRAGFLSVRDHGPGIPPKERERVTERFYRGRDAPSGGSGLGLAIARELSEKWGGSLTISNAEEGGANVEVRLPLADAAEQERR